MSKTNNIRLTLKTAKALIQQEFNLSATKLKAEHAEGGVYIYTMKLGRFDITVSNDWYDCNGLFKIKLSTRTGAVINIYYDPVTLEEDFDAHEKELDEIRKDHCFGTCEFAKERYKHG